MRRLLALVSVLTLAPVALARGDGSIPLTEGRGDGSIPLRLEGSAVPLAQAQAPSLAARIRIRSLAARQVDPATLTRLCGNANAQHFEADGDVQVGEATYRVLGVCHDDATVRIVSERPVDQDPERAIVVTSADFSSRVRGRMTIESERSGRVRYLFLGSPEAPNSARGQGGEASHSIK